MIDPNKAWQALEDAHYAVVRALQEKLTTEKIAERAFAMAYKMARQPQNGKAPSIDDAKINARLEPSVIEREDEAIKAEVEYQKARGTYDNQKILSEMRRSEEASLRGMRV